MDLSLLWRAVRARYRDQKAELRAIQLSLGDGDAVCDIGAHKGSYLYWLARWVQNGHVFAFEPQQLLATYLQRAFSQTKNVTIETMGVHATSGTRALYADRAGSPSATFSPADADHAGCGTPVDTVTLDDYFGRLSLRPSLIKIDAEGSELAIFKGARRLLSEASPALLFECEQRHIGDHTIFDVFNFLQDLGYKGSFFCGDRLLPLTDFEPYTHQPQRPGAWNEPGYCNNFFFSRRRPLAN